MIAQLSGWEDFQKSFGVSSILNKDAIVYFHVIFNSHLLGTVADLLAVQLKKDGVDEFRLRALLVFLILPAYHESLEQNQKVSFFRSGVKENLENPLLLECAVNPNLFVVSISFSLGEKSPFKLEDIEKRIASRSPESPWEQALVDLDRMGEKVALKISPELRKGELTVFLTKGAHADRSLSDSLKTSAFELIILKKEDVRNAPAPKAYVSLGDLDYTKMLRPDPTEGRDVEKKLKAGFTEEAARKKLKGGSSEEEGKTHVGGRAEEVAQREVIAGKSKPQEELETRVQGSEEEEKTFFKRIGKLWNRKKVPSSSVKTEEPHDSPALDSEIRKVAPQKASPQESSTVILQDQEIKVPEPVFDEAADPDETVKLVQAIPTPQADELIHSAQQQLEKADPSKVSEQDRKWLEILGRKLTAEKNRLAVLANRLEHLLKVKEGKFRNDLIVAQQELGKRETEVSQKSQQILVLHKQLEQLKEELVILKAPKKGAETEKVVVAASPTGAQPEAVTVVKAGSAAQPMSGAEVVRVPEPVTVPEPELAPEREVAPESEISKESGTPTASAAEIKPAELEDPNKLVKAIVEPTLDYLIHAADEELINPNNATLPEKTRKWLEALGRQLKTEKIRLGTLATQIEHSFQLKENKYKSEIIAGGVELNRRDLELKRRNEQTQFLTRQLEKVKEDLLTLKRGGPDSELSKAKDRSESLQKMLMHAKTENAEMMKRVNDLSSSLSSTKLLLSKVTENESGTPKKSPDDVSESGSWKEQHRELMGKFNAVSHERDLQAKRLEELKKANQNLVNHLKEPGTDQPIPGAGAVDKMKMRLEVSMQLLAKARNENVELKAKTESLEEENQHLKAQTKDLESRIKSIK